MSFGNTLREDILDEIFGATDYTAPVNLEFDLSTTAPNDDGTNITPPPAADYASVTYTNDKTTWETASSTTGGTATETTSLSNAIAIEWAEAQNSWGEVTHFAIYDASDSSFMAWGSLDIAKTIQTGDQARFAIGDLTIEIT